MNAEAETLQRSLAAKGFRIGSIDGVLGSKTLAALLCHCVGAPHDNLPPLATAMAAYFPQYDITTRNRVLHFLAQGAEETEDFRTLQEDGSATYFARYDGRADLGNTQPGDGARYHGRGIFQITGRYNYRHYGQILRLDLEGSPETAAQPDVAVRTAGLFWHSKNLNALADENDLIGITRRINGGENGLANRRYYFNRLQLVWPT